MSEKSGKTRWAEPVMLGLAVALVSLGMTGFGKALFGGDAVWTESWRSNLLLAGVVLAVGALAASAYRSRSQIDIDRLQAAAQKVREDFQRVEDVRKLLLEAPKYTEQAKAIGVAYEGLRAELAKVGDYAAAAKLSEDSIQALNVQIRKVVGENEEVLRKIGGSAAAAIMTKWELGNAQWNGDDDAKALARLLFYEGLIEKLHFEGEILPKPTKSGWEACAGDFSEVEDASRQGEIVAVIEYEWRWDGANRRAGNVRGRRAVTNKATVATRAESVQVEPTVSGTDGPAAVASRHEGTLTSEIEASAEQTAASVEGNK